MRVAGKTALVMGAGQSPGETIGNGRAIATLLAREGAHVWCADRDLARAEETVAAIRTEGGQAEAIACDVTKRADCDAAVVAAGALDILVNNVGIGGNDGPAHTIADDAFDRILAVNLKGVLNGIAAAVPGMRERKAGAIVSISSLAGIAGWHMVAYETSKAAVNRLTQSTALANAEYGIRVNAVAPGPILTHHLERAGEKYQRMAAEAMPMRRIGLPSEVADAAVWLSSEQSSFVTGTTVVIDGGKMAGTPAFSAKAREMAA